MIIGLAKTPRFVTLDWADQHVRSSLKTGVVGTIAAVRCGSTDGSRRHGCGVRGHAPALLTSPKLLIAQANQSVSSSATEMQL